MASQRVNELNTLSVLNDADLILSFDSSESETKAITRSDLRADLEPTAGDGLDLTSNTLTVDLGGENPPTVTVSGATTSAYDGVYTVVAVGAIDGSDNFDNSSGNGSNKVYWSKSDGGSGYHVLYANSTSGGYYVAQTDTDPATFTDDAATGIVSDELISNSGEGFDTLADIPSTWGDDDTLRIPNAGTGGLSPLATFTYSAGSSSSGLEFVGGKLSVDQDGLSITESQISDLGSYATTASVSNVDNTADADKPVSTAQQTALDLKIGSVAEDTTPTLGGELDADSNKIVGLAEPTVNTDAATKNYVDVATSGQGAFWTPVQLEAASNVSSLTGEQTIDGVLTSSSRILLTSQSVTSENGIYVTSGGTWQRATDANDDSEFKTNKTVFIQEGTDHSGNIHAYTGSDDPTLDTDAITFVLKSSAAAIADGSITDAKIADVAATKLTGSIADARVAETNVTQHQAALSITESQISDLQTYLTAVAEGDVTAHEAALTILSTQISGTLTAAQVPAVEGLNATYTADTEPANYYFLVVDSNGDIKRLNKDFMEV